MTIFEECLAKRAATIGVWTQGIVTEVQEKLHERIAHKICLVVQQRVSSFQDAYYVLPSSEKPMHLCFSFNLAGGLCPEIMDSLADNSVIKDWVKRLKEWQKDSGEPNYQELNRQMDYVAEAVKTQLCTKIGPHKDKNDRTILDFSIHYPTDSRSAEYRKLKVSFWVPPPSQPAPLRDSTGYGYWSNPEIEDS
jgi:hypothetical protein